MNAIVAPLWLVARKLWNFDTDATGGGFWTSTTTYLVTVPAGKRWYFIGGVAYPHANATVIVRLGMNGGGTGLILASYAAGTLEIVYPDATHMPPGPVIMDEGDNVLITFGAAQDATSYCTCAVLEVDV